MGWLGRVFGVDGNGKNTSNNTKPAAALGAPVRKQGPYTWLLESIRAARDAQLRGQFDLPVRLAEAFRTDDALFTAYQARVATQSSLALEWSAAEAGAGKVSSLDRAKREIVTPQHTRESLLGTLANHGVAIGYVQYEPQPDGVTRMLLTEWPLEHVRFNPTTDRLETRVKDGSGPVTITHGDGRWVVFRKFGIAPWTQDACVLPGALLWAAHASGLSDWAAAAYSHGQIKLVGTLPDGFALQGTDGVVLTPDAQAFLNMLAGMSSGEVSAAVTPFGSKTELLTNGSTAWQVFEKLIENRERAAARIYLGTDALLGAQGGAPGVDIAALFNVASTRIQGDLDALERGYREGMIEPWCRFNGIPLKAAPRLTYLVPDPDADKRSEQASAAVERLSNAMKHMRDAQLEVSQEVVNALALVLAVPVPTVLASKGEAKVPIALAPTDIARVVRVDEARAAQGLPALGDERGKLFISELEALAEAQATQAQADAAPEEKKQEQSAEPAEPAPVEGEPAKEDAPAEGEPAEPAKDGGES
jgi:hypothetical protein